MDPKSRTPAFSKRSEQSKTKDYYASNNWKSGRLKKKQKKAVEIADGTKLKCAKNFFTGTVD